MRKHTGDRPLYRVRISPQNRLAREKLKDVNEYENVCGTLAYMQLGDSASHLFVTGAIDTASLEQLLTELLYKNGGADNVKTFVGNMLARTEAMTKNAVGH